MGWTRDKIEDLDARVDHLERKGHGSDFAAIMRRLGAVPDELDVHGLVEEAERKLAGERLVSEGLISARDKLGIERDALIKERDQLRKEVEKRSTVQPPMTQEEMVRMFDQHIAARERLVGQTVHGAVASVGGGIVTVWLERDTESYPMLGARCELRWFED